MNLKIEPPSPSLGKASLRWLAPYYNYKLFVEIWQVHISWIKTISKHKQLHLPVDLGWTVCDMMPSSPPTWELVIYPENMDIMGCICLAAYKGEISFCLCNLFIDSPVIRITFWLNVYATIKLFSFSSPSMEKLLAWQEILFWILFPHPLFPRTA